MFAYGSLHYVKWSSTTVSHNSVLLLYLECYTYLLRLSNLLDLQSAILDDNF